MGQWHRIGVRLEAISSAFRRVRLSSSRKIRFDPYEADLEAGELLKNGRKLKLSGQPFQVLSILLERPGQIVTREELQKCLWPDTFVDVDHNLNTAINKIREVLGDSSASPRFVETLPRRGYRFIAAVKSTQKENNVPPAEQAEPMVLARLPKKRLPTWAYVGIAIAVLSTAASYFVYRADPSAKVRPDRILSRVTFASGLQVGVTWSPDASLIAYASNQGGKFDIWVQQLSGGNPVQVTHRAGDNWQPDWSPDGKSLVYRSEDGEGGLFVMPATGGEGQERKISSFGYDPQWSPDGSRILLQASGFASTNSFYVVGLDGEPPKSVLGEFFAGHQFDVAAADWYPDGKKISLSIWNTTPIPEFWTVPIGSAEGVKTELDRAVVTKFEESSANYSIGVELMDFKFRWAPSADAIYFERTLRGVKNLWRLRIEGNALRGTAIDRLTTGAGADAELALSPDGTKVAYTTEAVHSAAWLFPFDAASGRLGGAGAPIPSPGSETDEHAITRDGSKIAFVTERHGKTELWEEPLTEQGSVPVLVDNREGRAPAWSQDGNLLAYFRAKTGSQASEIAVWSSESRAIESLTSASPIFKLPYDWSPDGRELLIAQATQGNNNVELWSLPTSRVSGGMPRKIAGDSRFKLWQPHFSPDGRWIVFEGEKPENSALYVISAEGGPWVPIPPRGHWDDKPRWSPDGRTIYYVSETHGFFNVWGIHFNPTRGIPVGKPFRVTKFESPNLMIPTYIPPVELSISKDKLVINLAEVSGSVWMLENVR
jgi:Tol biopolymer transport system component/DNA-binding winged helix-turn-helix (wHTH) protein